MWREVARFEFALQRREFLSWIYVAVFFLLTFGYASSGAIELVSGREGVFKNAPWALAHAMAGVTAFGQVITTMIAATAVMRDVAARTQELLFTTKLSRGAYLAGRYAGAVAVMAVVYLAIPAGLLIGSRMPWVDGATVVPFSASAYLRPLALLVAPNVVVVSTLFFAAGALRKGFMAILLLGLALVALWQSGLALSAGGATWAGVLLDPFGNAALEASTAGWSAADRNVLPIPVSPFLLASRAVWLAIAAGAAVLLVRRFRFELVPVGASDHRPVGDREGTSARPTLGVSAMPAAEESTHGPTSRGATPHAVIAEARWIFAWTLREKGFRTLAALAALNGAANAWGAGAGSDDAGPVLAALFTHSRVLLILVATIYAGELVWRDRDVRVHELRDALPPSSGALFTGKLLGILAAELLLVAPLALVALVIQWRHGALDLNATATWVVGNVFAFVAQLTVLSLLVHAVVQDKVAGHVLLIAGWVLAVAITRTTEVPALLRFATQADGPAPGAAAGWHALYWSAVSLAVACVASAWWVRGSRDTFAVRAGAAWHRLRGLRGILLLAAVVLAIGCGWRASIAAQYFSR